MDVSIIIPSFNTQQTIDTTLKQIQNQLPAQGEVEVLVVDCSPHEEVAAIVSRYDFARIHRQQTRFNPGIGRNIGASLASGKLLMFIDADVELTSGTLDAAIRHHRDGVKIFGGALEVNPRTAIGMTSFIEHYYFNSESQSSRPPTERNNLSSAFMCFDKEVFLSEGGFKDIPRMQDTELTEKLRQKGYRLMFFPDIQGLQTQDSPLRKVLKKIYINGQNLYYIRYQQHIRPFKKLAFLLALPLITLAKVSRIILRHLRYQDNKGKMTTLALTPMLYLCGIYWMVGFYHAMIFEPGIAKERH